MRDGRVGLNSTLELMADLGRPRGDRWEVGLWEDGLTVEHPFQATKTLDKEERKTIQDAPTPATAKRLGRRVTLRADWEQVKWGLMYDLLKQKFSRPDLRQMLLETGEAERIEGNTWGDRVWGCVLVKGQWIGKNQLGQLLMQARAELRVAERLRP